MALNHQRLAALEGELDTPSPAPTAPPHRPLPDLAARGLFYLGEVAWSLTATSPLAARALAPSARYYERCAEDLRAAHDAAGPDDRAQLAAWCDARPWAQVLDEHARYYTAATSGLSPVVHAAAWVAAQATNRARLEASGLYRDLTPDDVVEKIARAAREDDPAA